MESTQDQSLASEADTKAEAELAKADNAELALSKEVDSSRGTEEQVQQANA